MVISTSPSAWRRPETTLNSVNYQSNKHLQQYQPTLVAGGIVQQGSCYTNNVLYTTYHPQTPTQNHHHHQQQPQPQQHISSLSQPTNP